MPLVDAEGNPVEDGKIVSHVRIPVHSIVIEHDKVTFRDDHDVPLVEITRPTHPGAGLAVDLIGTVGMNLD